MNLEAHLLSDGGHIKEFVLYLPHCREPVLVDWGEVVAVYSC